eukprot:COSAG01_NODE_2846_length_6985_cov_212.725860_6_plen_52_part_00
MHARPTARTDRLGVDPKALMAGITSLFRASDPLLRLWVERSALISGDRCLW